jgi:hypothetical protein
MSKTPLKTRYASTDPAAVELGWKLKRINETHEMRQRALMEEYRAKSTALTDASQVEQSAVFNELATKVGLGADDYGDGKGWALNIERMAEGEVAMVHESDGSREDNCQCPVCQLRRSLSGASDLDDAPRLH